MKIAVLSHESWDEAKAYRSADAAEQAMIAMTAEYRSDYDDCIGGKTTDSEWIDVCLSEGWTIQNATLIG